MERTPNIELLELAAKLLRPLLGELVFLGGCATDLLITDPGAPKIRATSDVDAIVEVGGLIEYHKLEGQLRDLGFTQSMFEDAPICRWRLGPLMVDIMPTDPDILGFGNDWYQAALKDSVSAILPNGVTIRHVTAPYFIATKIDAFKSRGESDYLTSHDFEDLVAVLDGRLGLADELIAGPPDVLTYITTNFSSFLADSQFHAALPGVIAGAGSSPPRSAMVIDTMKRVTGPPIRD